MEAIQNDQDVEMIRESAAAIMPTPGDLQRVRSQRFDLPGFSRDTWKQIAEMGWLGLRVDEDAGGSGLGMRAFCALAEQLGRGLIPEPVIPCIAASRLMRGQTLERFMTGDLLVIPAWHENALADGGAASGQRDGRIEGRWQFIPMAAGAGAFLVTTPTGAAVVGANDAGVTLTTDFTQNGGHFGTLVLRDVSAELYQCNVADALDEAALATSAYLLGVMDRAFEMSLDYLKIRQQFGRPIGSFQSLQHRAADLKLQIALTRASVESAAAIADSGAPPQVRRAAISRAKARAADAAMLVTRQAIQLHGGIGYTDEHDVGLFLRSAMVHCNQYGSASFHRARFAKLAPDSDEG